MKRKLFAIGLIATSFLAKAQVFYAGDQSKMFVAQKALVYCGGNWMVNSTGEKTIENKGNIIIVGDYKKGSISDAAQDGKEFVNTYTNVTDYGQVKLLNATGTSDARMTVERPAANSGYFGSWFPISFPYVDNTKYIMKSFSLNESDFKGDSRYQMTILKWNNRSIQLDGVTGDDKYIAGDYYNLNLTDNAGTDIRSAMSGNVSYKGTPSGVAYNQVADNRTISGITASQFNNLTYNEWKVRQNSYREQYQSYMGAANTNSKVYNKNIFRFGNPYTSNLDLSSFDGADAWLKITNKGPLTLKQAYDRKYIANFSITKRMPDYDTNWNIDGGLQSTNYKYYTAKFDGSKWTGSAEALLIRPTETFNVNFPALDPTLLGSRILSIQVDFRDTHKTFDHTAGAKYTESGQGLNTDIVQSASYNSSEMKLAQKASSIAQNSDFYQLEVILAKNDRVQASPVYIVGAPNHKETGANSSYNDKVFVYGIKDSEIALNSKKDFNEFNSDTYIAKPLGLGLNNLENGNTYQLKFALYEDSIFNKVDTFKNGVFYVKDNVTKKVTTVNPNEALTFVADSNTNENRFVFYWKQLPQEQTLSAVNVVANTQSTVVYKDGKQQKVRFENIANTAKVEVYGMAGTLVSSKDGVSTSSDFALQLSNEGVYVVKVTYQNGEVRTLKVVNN